LSAKISEAKNHQQLTALVAAGSKLDDLKNVYFPNGMKPITTTPAADVATLKREIKDLATDLKGKFVTAKSAIDNAFAARPSLATVASSKNKQTSAPLAIQHCDAVIAEAEKN
jgi:hypothetical protein